MRVVSTAHAAWFGPRRQRVAALDAARSSAATGSVAQQQLDWALLIRVAAEFQAFCLDMHELVLDQLISNTATQNNKLEIVLRVALRPVSLSIGNPSARNIAKDFARLGVPKIWNLAGSGGVAAKDKLSTLDLLLKARNAVAHGQYSDIARHLKSVSVYDFVQKNCLPDLDHVVRELDYALSAFIDQLFGLGRPW